ncbi:E3 ubiquitin-protein ligase RAD18 [Antennarius striatus]|uniref:E3 ubiquitin-protein ligase RAD18 n=1 Tax=Antennarius striatus TaxID=241820 RepID=UPI0035B24B9F
MASQIEPVLPPSLECLNNVETLLHCPICFDFLNISMMTKCSHNFCSLCIRKFFSYKLQCPVCNTQATEQDLRNNRILDDLVVNFKAARKQLSKAIFESPPISPKTPKTSVKCKTTREMSQKHNSCVLSQYFQKRPKTSPTDETHQDRSLTQRVQQGKIATSTHNVSEAELHSTNAQLTVDVKKEPMDWEEESVQVLMSVKQEDTDSQGLSIEAEIANSSSPPEDIKPTIKVECPVCSVGVSQQFINKHLDMCLNSAEKKESLRSSIGATRRPKGKLVYNLLSMQELRRRLKECHLSVKGSRDQLIKRHQEFVHTYNAQCDSLNPKSAEDIAREVENNEKSRNQLQGETKPVMVLSKKLTEEEIDEIHAKYRKQHSSEFSRLIAQVQGRLETTRQTRIKQEITVEEENKPATYSAEPNSLPVVREKDAETEAEEEPSASIKMSPSPTHSDVSISSSISDIFGPEPQSNTEDTNRTSTQKRKSSARGDGTALSPVLGKRCRKS